MRFSSLAFLALLLPLALAAPAAAEGPTQQDLASYEQEVIALQAEMGAMLGVATQPMRAGAQLQVFERHFKVKKKSSSITRALRRAKDELKGQVQAWFNSIAAQGYVPVDNPEPVQQLDHKWGMSGLKFYVRLKLYLKIWCMKPGS